MLFNLMNEFYFFGLKILRKIYEIIFPTILDNKDECIQDANLVSKTIYDLLSSDNPCMISRFGYVELDILSNYLGVLKRKNIIDYIKLKQTQWWWDKSFINTLNINAGFFPTTHEKIEQFCCLMLEDIPQVDILGSWLLKEVNFNNYLVQATKVRLMYLDPFWSKNPWTAALKGKRILVVHPFAKSIEKQYLKRELLFKNKNLIPQFESLTVIKAVQSIDNQNLSFNDWFEALEFMKCEIDKVEYDICLIGCGAYGFPLAAHVKRAGRKAFHLGGSLQLLFGIRGKRWELKNDPHLEPGSEIPIDYYGLPNEHWVRPSKEETPKNHFKVEGSCYW